MTRRRILSCHPPVGSCAAASSRTSLVTTGGKAKVGTMFAGAAVLLLCVLVAISEGSRATNCSDYPYDVCPMNYNPVCGTDGITYGNECMMCGAIKKSEDKIQIRNEGECCKET